MAKNKNKNKIDSKEKLTIKYIHEYGEDDQSYYWQEYTDEWGNYDYYYNSDGVKLCITDDQNRIRQEKIDVLLGINGKPTLGDILPQNISS